MMPPPEEPARGHSQAAGGWSDRKKQRSAQEQQDTDHTGATWGDSWRPRAYRPPTAPSFPPKFLPPPPRPTSAIELVEELEEPTQKPFSVWLANESEAQLGHGAGPQFKLREEVVIRVHSPDFDGKRGRVTKITQHLTGFCYEATIDEGQGARSGASLWCVVGQLARRAQVLAAKSSASHPSADAVGSLGSCGAAAPFRPLAEAAPPRKPMPSMSASAAIWRSGGEVAPAREPMPPMPPMPATSPSVVGGAIVAARPSSRDWGATGRRSGQHDWAARATPSADPALLQVSAEEHLDFEDDAEEPLRRGQATRSAWRPPWRGGRFGSPHFVWDAVSQASRGERSRTPEAPRHMVKAGDGSIALQRAPQRWPFGAEGSSGPLNTSGPSTSVGGNTSINFYFSLGGGSASSTDV